MIRPFQLRDWGLVQQLSQHSVPLNASLILLYPSSPVRAAISHRLLQRNYPTYVWRSDKAPSVQGYVQLRVDKGHSQANVLWVGSILSKRPVEGWTHQRVWQGLFDELAVYLGQNGIQNVVAEARENSVESDILRDIGFANYTRQDLYKLELGVSLSAEMTLLQNRQTVDDWNIEKLYAHSVPNMIRLIEPHPPYGEDSWVCYEDDELVTYAHVTTGRDAKWLRLYGNMNAKTDASDMIGEIVKEQSTSATIHTLFSSVRPYQSWLAAPLEKNGFQYLDSQLVMVRHTVQPIRASRSSLEKLLATNGATARTTPIVHKQESKSF